MVANRAHAASSSVPAAESAGLDTALTVPAGVELPSNATPANGLAHLETIAHRDPQVAAYIGHMTIEMAAMARAAGFDLLAYFLDMARIESNIQAGREG
ncbi:MAG: hypothetical protein ACRCTD_15840 [Beijerinckiaceae bacterium]